jgi:hypothetical protein
VKVRAIQSGFIYGLYRYPGSVFELKLDEDFSENWMEKVGDNEPIIMTQPAPPTPDDALKQNVPMVVAKPSPSVAELERLSVANTPRYEPVPGSDPVVEQPEKEETEQEPAPDGPPSGDRQMI